MLPIEQINKTTTRIYLDRAGEENPVELYEIFENLFDGLVQDNKLEFHSTRHQKVTKFTYKISDDGYVRITDRTSKGDGVDVSEYSTIHRAVRELFYYIEFNSSQNNEQKVETGAMGQPSLPVNILEMATSSN